MKPPAQAKCYHVSTTDTTLVQSVSGVSLSIALRTTVSLVGGLVMLALTSVQLTGYILLGIPVVILPMIIVGRRIRRQSRVTQDRVADTSGLADETLNAMQTVQAFTLERLQSERYAMQWWTASRRPCGVCAPVHF